jgi:hypothetical protein
VGLKRHGRGSPTKLWLVVWVFLILICGLFGSAISISAILKIAFLKIVFLKLPLFKIAQAFGKTG